MPALRFRRNPLAGSSIAALVVLLFALPGALTAQTIVTVAPEQCVWRTGDNLAWAAPNLDETGWQPYTQWKPQYGEVHFWVRCHADLHSLRNEANPALQVSLNAAYAVYLDGRQIGGAGSLQTGSFSVDSIRSFPIAGPFSTGPSTIAVRSTYRSRLSNSSPIIALLATHLVLRAGDGQVLDALRAGEVLARTSQYAESGLCYGVIAVIAVMLLGLFFYDRSRREILLLSIACMSVSVLRINEFCTAALLNFSVISCLMIVLLGNLGLTITQVPFYYALARRRVPLLFWIFIAATLLSYSPGAIDILIPAGQSPLLSSISETFIRPFALVLHMILTAAPFFAFWPYQRILPRMRPLAVLCMLWAVADFVWFVVQATAIPIPGVQNVFVHWGVILLEVRAFTTAGVLTGLLALLFRDQRQATEEHALFAGEISAARNVQQYLIPEHLPPTPGFSIESEYRPAREVGGDFFQILPHAVDGSLLIVVGDVAGKGIEAGMLATLIVGAVRTAATFTSDPARILALLNERLCGRGFVTCLALRIEADGAATLVNAGHLPPYLNGKELAVEGSLPLGAVAGMQFPAFHFQLSGGDSIMLMTDGVAEAQDEQGQLFGFGRIGELLHKGAGGAALAAAAQNFGQQDDITILTLIRVTPSQLDSSGPALSALASA